MDSDSPVALSYDDITSSEATLLDAESIATDSVADLEDFDDDRHVGYDENTGDLIVNTIPPSDIPHRLPIVTSEQIWEMERTCVVTEDLNEWRKIRAMGVENIESSESSDGPGFREVTLAEPIDSSSDWSTDNNNNLGNTKADKIYEDVSEEEDWDLEEISEGSLEGVEETVDVKPKVEKRAKDSPCPLRDCEFIGRKLKFHVQQMHLPRLVWDNPQPPLREERYGERDKLRHELLLLVAEFLTGKRDLATLVKWANANVRRRIPRRSEILARNREQMRSFCGQVGIGEPFRYTLVPIHSPCVLLHWRYQVLFTEHFARDQLVVYLSHGWNFMCRMENLKESPFDYAKTHSLLACILAGEQMEEEEDDEANMVMEDTHRRVIIKKPEESWEEVVPSKRARVESVEPRPTQAMVHPAYDSHFHLDRSSRRISGSATKINVETLLQHQMERPPIVPVNLQGGLIIYCDPATYPETVPFDGKWKVSIGLHPKSVGSTSNKEKEVFFELITNTRVSAVGEVGLDTSLHSGQTTLQQQKTFLAELCPKLKTDLPIILHIRGHHSDLHSENLYGQAFDILKHHCQLSQQIVLHCFTGNISTVQLYLSTFSNTYFGFTHIITTFDQAQLKALREIPKDRLLAETDAPYIPPTGIRVNTPIYIGEIIRILATMRYTDIESIALCTTNNAKTIFK